MGQDLEWSSIAPQMLQVPGRGELAFCDVFYVAFVSKASKDQRVSKNSSCFCAPRAQGLPEQPVLRVDERQ